MNLYLCKYYNEERFYLSVLALITGVFIHIQAATNAVFSKSIGNPLITGLMVYYNWTSWNDTFCFNVTSTISCATAIGV